MLYEVRWSRSQKRFVWVPERGPDVLAYETDGFAEFINSDNEQGRLHVVVDKLEEVELSDGNLLVIAHQEPMLVVPPEGAVELAMADRCRMCYRRSHKDFRARDEDGSGNITFVTSFRGQGLIDWHNHAGHLLVHNKVFLHNDIAYFVNR